MPFANIHQLPYSTTVITMNFYPSDHYVSTKYSYMTLNLGFSKRTILVNHNAEGLNIQNLKGISYQLNWNYNKARSDQLNSTKLNNS